MQELQETQLPSLGPEDPLEKEMATCSSVLAGESHGRRGLVGYSPWGRKEPDTTEHALASPLQILRWANQLPKVMEEETQAQVCSASEPKRSVTTLSCRSVVSICGIESEFYYLQIAGHKHPNSISDTRALEISFLLVQALQGAVLFNTF